MLSAHAMHSAGNQTLYMVSCSRLHVQLLSVVLSTFVIKLVRQC